MYQQASPCPLLGTVVRKNLNHYDIVTVDIVNLVYGVRNTYNHKNQLVCNDLMITYILASYFEMKIQKREKVKRKIEE